MLNGELPLVPLSLLFNLDTEKSVRWATRTPERNY